MLDFNSIASSPSLPFKAHTQERQERLADQLRGIFPDFVPTNSTPIAKKKYLDLQRTRPPVPKSSFRYGLPLFLTCSLLSAYIALIVIPRRQLRNDIRAGKLGEIMKRPETELNMHEKALRRELEEQQDILVEMQSVYEEQEQETSREMRMELSQYLGKK